MQRWREVLLVSLATMATIALSAPAFAMDPEEFGDTALTASQPGHPQSHNLELLGNSPRPAPFFQSDLAFAGRYAYAGNYNGFRIVDVLDPQHPVQVGIVECNGLQGDVSVWRNWLFLSVDRPQTAEDCTSQDTPPTGGDPPTTDGWEGIRIFDVSDPASVGPHSLVAAVRTRCGSHTHTLAPDQWEPNLLHIYVSSYPTGASNLTETCQPPHGVISVIHVPLTNPSAATVSEVALDPDTLPRHGTQAVGCHDITVFLEIDLAAGSCLGEGQLWHISDRGNPALHNPVHVRNAHVEFWHNAAFTWNGKVVAFGDEAGGGGQPRCRSTDPETLGAIWFYPVVAPDGRDQFVLDTPFSHFKIPRPQDGPGENCTAHNFNFITRAGRHVLISAWYQGGTSVVDVTNPWHPSEVAYWDPPALDPPQLGGQWSTYWHNSFVYANDITRGLDVFRLTDGSGAHARRLPRMNPQTQEFLIP